MEGSERHGTASGPKEGAHVAVMAHNEEGNISSLLDRITAERIQDIEIQSVVVVSSGSTDATDELVAAYRDIDPRVKLLTQEKRFGKCAAINLFLETCPPDAPVVLLSGDILPDPGAIGRLLKPLLDPEVGMTGGRPVPVNDPATFFGFTAHLIWNIHHQIALKHPKLGEAVAFRKIADSIPEDLAVDEAALEALVRKKGLKLRYCEDALIRNRGPDNLRDFLKQRRRIQTGHLHLRKKLRYKVSTFSIAPGIRALFAAMEWRPKFVVWAVTACLLVLTGRILGSLDYYLMGRRHAVWDIAESTKGTLSQGSSKG